ncbi:MAG: hypothetical protein ABFS16_09980 [Bacteroidota bacterium]
MASTTLKIGFTINIKSKQLKNLDDFEQKVTDFETKTIDYINNLFNNQNNFDLQVPASIYNQIQTFNHEQKVNVSFEYNPDIPDNDLFELDIPEIIYNQCDSDTFSPVEGKTIKLLKLERPDITFYGVDKDVDGFE